MYLTSWKISDLVTISRKRMLIYGIALGIRLLLAPFFMDRLDTFVFLETSRDVLIDHQPLYYEGSLQYKFNYFPLAYLPILMGSSLYHWFLPSNLYLERVMLKLPMILADLVLAYLIRKKIKTQNNTIYDVDTYELFILFNPILIYASAMKGQIDVFAGICILLSLFYFKDENYIRSGLFMGLSIMVKQYGVLVLFYMGIYILRFKFKDIVRFGIGVSLGVVPVLLFGAFLNLDGMIDHAIMYHVDRIPSGLSLTSVVYYILLFGVEFIGFQQFAIQLSSIVLFLMTLMLIGSLLYLGVKVLQSDGSLQELMDVMYLSFLIAFLLNKVSYLQYAYPIFILFIETYRYREKDFSRTIIAWEVLLIPFAVIFRVAHFTPVDIQQFLGTYWITILWAIGLIIHILTFAWLKRRGEEILPSSTYRNMYALLIVLHIINLPVQLLLDSIPEGVI